MIFSKTGITHSGVYTSCFMFPVDGHNPTNWGTSVVAVLRRCFPRMATWKAGAGSSCVVISVTHSPVRASLRPCLDDLYETYPRRVPRNRVQHQDRPVLSRSITARQGRSENEAITEVGSLTSAVAL